MTLLISLAPFRKKTGESYEKPCTGSACSRHQTRMNQDYCLSRTRDVSKSPMDVLA